MNRTAAIAIVVASLFATFAVTGCADDAADTSEPGRDRQIISGRIDDGDRDDTGGLSTKTAVRSGNGEIHVVAHRLHAKNDVGVKGDIDTIVASDGTFDVKLERGARYVFEVRHGDESAVVGWNARRSKTKTNVLGISTNTKGKAAVSLGRVKVVGNGAVVERSPAESFDESDTTGIDLDASWYTSAKGALVTASEALEEAKAALEEGMKALEEGQAALEEGMDALEEAEAALDEADEALGEDSDDE